MTEAQHQQQRYRVIERLASGGMAEVFLAESAGIEGFKKNVAIKRVLPQLSEKRNFISMFLDEARLSAHLSHSNIVHVFDIGVGDDAYFIVMEYVDGADLKAVVEHGKKIGRPISVEVACLIAIKICEGLAYAHELCGNDGRPLSIVHRDVSPPNVLITKHGEVKIVDFGLAKASSQLEKSDPDIIKGKFSYLSPEAAHGREVDHRADIFAAGIILWEMLAGRRLFFGESDYGTVKLVQKAEVPTLSAIQPAVPVELDRALGRALAREPADRYASARDFAVDLTTILFNIGRPVSAFDLAELVRGAQSQRTKKAPEKTSFIDRLIEEALFEFTSLQDDKVNSSLAPKSQPVKVEGFESLDRFAEALADDLALAERGRASHVGIDVTAELGDLATLEDTDDRSLSMPNMIRPGPDSASVGRAPEVVPTLAPRPNSRATSPGPSRVIQVVIVAIVLTLAAVAAWFTQGR